MNYPLTESLKAFSMNSEMFNVIVRNVPQDKSSVKLHDNTNEFRRIALHLLVSRHHLGSLLEMEFAPLPWNNLGDGIMAGFLPETLPPTLNSILDEWQKCSLIFHEKLLTVTNEVLSNPSPFQLPGNPKANLGDFTTVSVFHEGYHIGQLGMIMKAVTGKSLAEILMPDLISDF